MLERHRAVDGFLVMVPFRRAGSGLCREAGRARMPSGGTIRLWETCEHGCVAMSGMWALLLTSTGRMGNAKREPLSLVASVWVQPCGDSHRWFQARSSVPQLARSQLVRWIFSPGENLVSSAKGIMLKRSPLDVLQPGEPR